MQPRAAVSAAGPAERHVVPQRRALSNGARRHPNPLEDNPPAALAAYLDGRPVDPAPIPARAGFVESGYRARFCPRSPVTKPLNPSSRSGAKISSAESTTHPRATGPRHPPLAPSLARPIPMLDAVFPHPPRQGSKPSSASPVKAAFLQVAIFRACPFTFPLI